MSNEKIPWHTLDPLMGSTAASSREIGETRLRRTAFSNAIKRWNEPTTPEQIAAVDADKRPLIDKLYEATFSDDVGMQWVEDKYALRTILRKAHCFTLDAHTSGLVADFSLAIAGDLDVARQLAIPPFPTTWFQIDNWARLERVKAKGVQLTATASRDDVIKNVGWLITTTGPDEYCASYVCHLAQGVMIPPLSYRWLTTPAAAINDKKQEAYAKTKAMLDKLIFGVRDTDVEPNDAWLFPASYQKQLGDRNGHSWLRKHELELMTELSGELRHIFGLLLALGAGQLGAETAMAPQAPPAGPPRMMKGKPLLPIEHKVLTIKLSKRHTVEKVTARAITGAKHRWHEVRGHWRTLHNPDGTVKKRVPVKAHERGDMRLGKIEKTYRIKT